MLTESDTLSITMLNLLPITAEIYLCLSAIVMLLFGVYAFSKINSWFQLSALLVLAFSLYAVSSAPVTNVLVLNNMFVVDAFTQYSKALILVGAFIVLMISGDWLTRESGKPFEYIILVLFSTLGLMLMVSSNTLLALYMSLELASLSLYVLAAFNRDDAHSSEAGLKYFMLGALASGMMLFGMSLLYGFTGTIEFGGLISAFAQYSGEVSDVSVPRGALVGMVLVIIGFCFKISAVPFHMWTPDTYQGAPTAVTAFFAIAPKIAALTLFARFLLVPMGELMPYWQPIIRFIAAASIIIGALAALRQHNIKRLMAYSSIGHVGFMLIGLAAGTTAGVQAMLVYLALYIFMSAGVFGCILLMQKEGHEETSIASLAGLSQSHPRIAFVLAVCMFSMAGIPPLAGFFGKFYVTLAAIEVGLVYLVVIGLLASVVSCFYYLRIVKLMYMDTQETVFDAPLRFDMRFGLAASTAVMLLFFLIPSSLIEQASLAAGALLN